MDVYRGDVKADSSIVSLGAYLCMFPQLIAGPIVVYSDICTELKARTISIEKLDNGLKTFIIGLGYKVIIANRIGTLWNEVCTIGFESISTPLAWLGAFAYSMQLYFDFCGYSLMAIGLGEMLGFHMPENFKHPYMARSVTDFWRRWHITLGAWFREYVYIPLGGNRKGSFHTICNLLVVWFLTGFWHGAAWNFILWGLFIFVLQIIEKNITLKWLTGDHIISKIVSHIYMIFYILISWTIFAISDFTDSSKGWQEVSSVIKGDSGCSERGRYTGEIFNLTAPGFGIQAFHVPFFTFFDGSTYIDFQEVFFSDDFRSHLTDGIRRTDKSSQGNDSAVYE